MKNLKKTLVVLFVTATFLFAGMSDLFARRGGGSRSSRPSSRSRTASSKPKTSSTRSKSTKPTTSKRATKAPKRTATQQKSFEASKKNGTSKMTKTQSIDKFKSDPAMKSKYTSKYASKPATRPSHVPQTTQVGGKTVNITYNQAGGGYGYMNALGMFMMYDMMSDAIMRNRMMTHNGYLYAGHPAVAGTTVIHTRSSGTILIWVLFGIIALVVIVAIVLKKK